MPAPIQYAHAILRRLAEVRKSGQEPTLGPDAKSQLSLRYEDGKPVEVTSIVLSTQHLHESQTSADIRAIVEPYIREVLPSGWISDKTEWWVNPTGTFVIGGPDGDAGLTGRKIIVDTYGGAAPHGGGAFSGKDPTKVDRSAAYAARYLAKNVVAAGLADRATIQLLCDRRGRAAVDLCRHARDRGRSRRRDRTRRGGEHGPHSARHPHASGAEQADLRAHLGLWALRSRTAARRRFFVGKDRSGRHLEKGGLSSGRAAGASSPLHPRGTRPPPCREGFPPSRTLAADIFGQKMRGA